MIKSINIRAIAKINIGLNVLNKRNDGYHNLSTLFYPIYDLYDEINIKHSDDFTFTSNFDFIADNHNLIVKAVKLLEKKQNRNFNISISLDKKLPIGAGLGGGSSDCASILASLNDMFSLGLNHKELIDISLELGSDVPFFIKPYPSIGTARGEKLERIDIEINKPILIVNPGIHISTKEAFQSLKLGNEKKLSDYGKISSNNITGWKNFIFNDFEDYVFETYNDVKNIKKTLYNLGADFALMSGTGSTVYGIFPNRELAEKAKAHFPKNYFTFISEV